MVSRPCRNHWCPVVLECRHSCSMLCTGGGKGRGEPCNPRNESVFTCHSQPARVILNELEGDLKMISVQLTNMLTRVSSREGTKPEEWNSSGVKAGSKDWEGFSHSGVPGWAGAGGPGRWCLPGQAPKGSSAAAWYCWLPLLPVRKVSMASREMSSLKTKETCGLGGTEGGPGSGGLCLWLMPVPPVFQIQHVPSSHPNSA